MTEERPPALPTGWDLRTQTLRDAYWAHREVPNRHRDEMCEDYCFPDIVERWVALMVERSQPRRKRWVVDGLDPAIVEFATTGEVEKVA